MANKKIQGITITIGGETTNLQKALKDVDKQVYALNGELKDLDKALKLDPKNTELLAQKQDVLKRNIEATTERLTKLKMAQAQMGDYKKLTDQQKESYNALSLEIAKAEDALKGMKKQLDVLPGINLDKLKDGLKKVGEIALDVTKKLLQVTAAVSGALAGVVTAGVKSYANLEKAQKGSQRLFENSFKTVQQNAAKAYKSLGLSATEYYDQVNTYAVGLKNALGGDTEAAAKLSDSILTAQADIVAATGADTQAVQNAFAAVMRGNYTMIDNLRLGIKGSQEGMQEVIDKVNEWRKENGESTMLVMGNYADMQQALVDYVEMQGIAGAAEKEMSSTISGSVTQMKAAWDNFLNGSGSPEALAETITNVLRNISTVIKQLAPSILQGLADLLKELLPQAISLIFELLPLLLDAVTQLIDQLLDGLKNNPGKLAETITSLINTLVQFIVENLPKILEAAILIVEELAKGLIKSLPTLINSAIDLVFTLVDTILDNLPEFIDVALDLIITLADGLIQALPKLLEKLPQIIVKIVQTLTNPEMLGKIAGIAPKLISSLWNAFKKMITETNWLELGTNIVKGILNGFVNITKFVSDKVKAVKDKIVGSFKSFFGIKSPSKLMADEVGTYIGEGVTVGILDGIDDTQRQVKDAMQGLASGIETSINPTINPSVSYETNYTLMARAMQEAMQGMEIELDDREVGKFVIKTVENEVYQ